MNRQLTESDSSIPEYQIFNYKSGIIILTRNKLISQQLRENPKWVEYTKQGRSASLFVSQDIHPILGVEPGLPKAALEFIQPQANNKLN